MTSRRHVSTGEVNNVVQTKLGSRLQCDVNWVKIAFLKKFKSLWPFSIWLNFDPTEANLLSCWSNCHFFVNGQILNK